jgi:CheY-like chemotaxis protein
LLDERAISLGYTGSLSISTISSRGGEFTPIRVLLVEDNPWDADVFRDYICDRASVKVVDSGAEAYDRLFRRGHFASEPLPHLIVLDLNIPLLTGHELLNAVKGHSTTCHIPVIVWSGSQSDRDVHKAYQLGACAYLLKSQTVPELEVALRAFSEFWLAAVLYDPLPH